MGTVLARGKFTYQRRTGDIEVRLAMEAPSGERVQEATRYLGQPPVKVTPAEIKVLEAFLPEAMPPEELRALVQAAIAETGAAAPADMGKVMKIVMAKVAGRAPNDMVSATVRELLHPR